MEKRRPILTVRPKFDSGLAMAEALVVTLGGFIVTTVVLGTFFFILLSLIGLGRHISASGIYGFFFGLSVLGIPPLFYEVKKRAFQRTIYNFYDDYMDFQYFHYYINRRRGRVRYADIADIAQHASALQEHQRLTTIYLYVPGMGMGRRGAFAGLRLTDLPQAKDYMTKVMDIIEQRQPVLQAPPDAGAAAPSQPGTAGAAPVAPATPATPAAPVVTPASPSSPPPVTDG
ncbi:MAG: hypothetical protein EPN97_15240 [Alphaproteobacteria bacterium]|nr:MAG: hypothetical protein EPN97_15240 [Alphaproteobacteria bacterium]